MMFRYQLTPDTELRLLEPGHTEEVYAAVEENRQYLRRWLPWVDTVRSAPDITLTRENLMQLGDKGHFAVGIWRQGRLSGVIGIHEIDWRNRQTSIGYWLAENAQGQGIMTRGCQAVISHLFGTLGLHRIEICAATGNLRSQSVAKRLGFRHEGTLRQARWLIDGPADSMVFTMLRDEWQDTGERLAFTHPLTEEAELRLLMPHDAEELFALTDRNRARLRPYMTWMDGTTCVEHSRSFIRYALQRMADGTEMHWGLWYRGRIAGCIGTLPINCQARSAEFGYWLGEEFQGKGLVTVASGVMLKYLFEVLELNRAELRIRTDNARSRAVAERLGFTLEGVLRQAIWSDGNPSDMACYALLREEWAQSVTKTKEKNTAGCISLASPE